MQLRDAVTFTARTWAGKKRSYKRHNEIDQLCIQPFRPLLKQLGQLGEYEPEVINWCAGWVCAVLRECGVEMPLRWDNYWATNAKVEGIRQTALRLGAFEWIGYNPQPGDLVLFQFDRDPEADHIGIFLYPDQAKPGFIRTAEGNVKNMEALKVRSPDNVLGYVCLERLWAGLQKKPETH